MVSLYTIPFIFVLSGIFTSFWPILAMFVLMGFGLAGIGLSVMHDANHGSYSKNKRVNDTLGWILSYVGGYHINWRIQHNVLHHSFTNVEGHDEDIQTGVMRASPSQERKPIHRFQAFYITFFYGLLTFYWIVGKDIDQLLRYDKMGLYEAQGVTFGKALFHIIATKILYLAGTLVLPIYILEIPWWQTVIAFFIMHFIGGLILALIFQPAHVIEETEFFLPDDEGSVENNWTIHQLLTTANFANGARAFSWFVGGLNYQVEHHLFPNICHVHYRKIAPIVEQTAKEYGIPYYNHKTFGKALLSHYKLLHDLGTGAYDRKKAKREAEQEMKVQNVEKVASLAS
ncbi:MAG: fatty acid desaturase family protein [Salibacteraceae bacterium]